MRKLPFTLLATLLLMLSLLSADAQIALGTLRVQAAEGDVKAQLDLAYRYRDGKGVTKDAAEAMNWAYRAADSGNADAMDFVGWWKKAAEQLAEENLDILCNPAVATFCH